MNYVDPDDPRAWWNADDWWTLFWENPAEDIEDYTPEDERLDYLYDIQERFINAKHSLPSG